MAPLTARPLACRSGLIAPCSTPHRQFAGAAASSSSSSAGLRPSPSGRASPLWAAAFDGGPSGEQVRPRTALQAQNSGDGPAPCTHMPLEQPSKPPPPHRAGGVRRPRPCGAASAAAARAAAAAAAAEPAGGGAGAAAHGAQGGPPARAGGLPGVGHCRVGGHWRARDCGHLLPHALPPPRGRADALGRPRRHAAARLWRHGARAFSRSRLGGVHVAPVWLARQPTWEQAALEAHATTYSPAEPPEASRLPSPPLTPLPLLLL